MRASDVQQLFEREALIYTTVSTESEWDLLAFDWKLPQQVWSTALTTNGASHLPHHLVDQALSTFQ
jgi:hypothetical protein